MYSLILLAGGQGSRMKHSVPKQYLLLHGKPIMVHVLERIDVLDKIGEIIITCPQSYIDKTKEIVESYGLTKKIIYTEGGATRQESTYNALKLVSSPSVIIHEAARPFVRSDEFEKLISVEDESATYALDIPFTVLKGHEYIEENLNRSELLNIQLPQKFNTKKLIEAHEAAIKHNKLYTEDASLYFEYTKEKIRVLEGTEYNIKITRPIDMKIAEIIYKDYIIGEE
jgi:2-C-methyl-D-erythritol 4-phosphate cytidylyltransferase